LKDSTTEDEDYGSEAGFSFDFGSNVQIPILKIATDQERPLDQVPPAPPKFRASRPLLDRFDLYDKDIAAYKRVIWQHSDVYASHPEGPSSFM
jgi:hypothetical protein